MPGNPTYGVVFMFRGRKYGSSLGTGTSKHSPATPPPAPRPWQPPEEARRSRRSTTRRKETSAVRPSTG